MVARDRLTSREADDPYRSVSLITRFVVSQLVAVPILLAMKHHAASSIEPSGGVLDLMNVVWIIRCCIRAMGFATTAQEPGPMTPTG